MIHIRAYLAACAMATASGLTPAGQLFHCKDTSGRTTFSDSPCAPTQSTVSARDVRDAPTRRAGESHYLRMERERKAAERSEREMALREQAADDARKQQEIENKLRLIEAMTRPGNAPVRTDCRNSGFGVSCVSR